MTDAWSGENQATITVFDDVDNSGAAFVGASLAAEITAGFGPRDEKPISVVARARGAVIGGLNGSIHWDWCYIRHLWVEADWRGRGLGRQLLAEAEMAARARRCAGLYADTFDAGARRFYERAGFAAFGRIDGFPPGHTRFFLQKRFVTGQPGQPVEI